MRGRGACSVVVVIALFAAAARAQEAPVVDPADPAPVEEPAPVVEVAPAAEEAEEPAAEAPQPHPRRQVIGLSPDDVADPLEDVGDPPEAPYREPLVPPEPDEPLLPSTKPIAELGPGTGAFTVAAGAAGGICLATPLVVLTLAMPCTLCAAMPMFAALGTMTGFWAADLPLQPGPVFGAALSGAVGSVLVFAGVAGGYLVALATLGNSIDAGSANNLVLFGSLLTGTAIGALLAAAGTGGVAWLLVDEPTPTSFAPKPARSMRAPRRGATLMAF